MLNCKIIEKLKKKKLLYSACTEKSLWFDIQCV